MASEQDGITPDAPLAASVGEQLREKEHLDKESEAERLDSLRRERTAERLIAEQREVAVAHGALPETWPVRRRAARDAPVRPTPGLGTLLLVMGAVALLTRVVRRR